MKNILISEKPSDRMSARISRDINKCHILDDEMKLGIYNHSS